MVSVVFLSSASGVAWPARLADALEKRRGPPQEEIETLAVSFDDPTLADAAWQARFGPLIDDADIVVTVVAAAPLDFSAEPGLKRALKRAAAAERVIIPVVAAEDPGFYQRYALANGAQFRALPRGGLPIAASPFDGRDQDWLEATVEGLAAEVERNLHGAQNRILDVAKWGQEFGRATDAFADAAETERKRLGDDLTADATAIVRQARACPQSAEPRAFLPLGISLGDFKEKIRSRPDCRETRLAAADLDDAVESLAAARVQAKIEAPPPATPERDADPAEPDIAIGIAHVTSLARRMTELIGEARDVAESLPAELSRTINNALNTLTAGLELLLGALQAPRPTAREESGAAIPQAARHHGRRGRGVTSSVIATRAQSTGNAAGTLAALLSAIPAASRERFERVVEQGIKIARRASQIAMVAGDLAAGRTGMVPIPPGAFWMGTRADDKAGLPDERPVTFIEFDHRFALGRRPVTVAQWRAAMEADAPLPLLKDYSFGGEDHPVVGVSWDDAQSYIKWLNAIRNLTDKADRYRLPSEAEWEYACRAGTQTHYSFGDEINPDLANYASKHGRGTTPVSRFPPNNWGLYDMHGNVWEWCEDAWKDSHEGLSKNGAARRGKAKAPRVLRGGSWDYAAWYARSACRNWSDPAGRNYVVGFRLARTLSDPGS